MSELIIPKFMQDLLDQIDGDEAWPEMTKLASAYKKQIEHLDSTLGNYGPKANIRDLYKEKKDWYEADFKEKALDIAKKHGLEEIKQEAELPKEEKKEEVEEKAAALKPEAVANKEESVSIKFDIDENREEITKKADDDELAAFMAEIKAAREKNLTNQRQL